jgi:hypothetical protein
VGCSKIPAEIKNFNMTYGFRNITAIAVIDCSLPEAFENETIEIVFGDIVYNHTNFIEMPFVNFCSLIKAQATAPEYPKGYTIDTITKDGFNCTCMNALWYAS